MSVQSHGRDIIKSIQFASTLFLTSQMAFLSPGLNYAQSAANKPILSKESSKRLKQLSKQEKELLKQLEELKQEKNKIKSFSLNKKSPHQKETSEGKFQKNLNRKKFKSHKIKKKRIYVEYRNQHYNWDIKPAIKKKFFSSQQYTKKSTNKQVFNKNKSLTLVQIKSKESIYCKMTQKGTNNSFTWIFKPDRYPLKRIKKENCKSKIKLIPLNKVLKPNSDFSWIFRQYPEDRDTTVQDILKGHPHVNLDRDT